MKYINFRHVCFQAEYSEKVLTTIRHAWFERRSANVSQRYKEEEEISTKIDFDFIFCYTSIASFPVHKDYQRLRDIYTCGSKVPLSHEIFHPVKTVSLLPLPSLFFVPRSGFSL